MHRMSNKFVIFSSYLAPVSCQNRPHSEDVENGLQRLDVQENVGVGVKEGMNEGCSGRCRRIGITEGAKDGCEGWL